MSKVFFVKKIIPAFYYKCISVCNRLLDFYLRRFTHRVETADLLLIRTDAIGDFVLWQDSLRAYRAKYRDKKVVLICNQVVAELALVDDFFTKVWPIIPRRFLFSFAYRCEIVKQLCSYSFNEVISPVYSRSYHLNDRLVLLASSPIKIGYEGNCSNITKRQKARSDRYYSVLVENKCDTTSELLINANFTKAVIDNEFYPGLSMLFFNVNNDPPIVSERYAVFSLSASYYPRAWAVENFVSVANQIISDCKIVLLGNGEVDEKKALDFLSLISDKEQIINLTGKTTLLNVVRIITKADFVVGNDSAFVHIAAATRTPSVCIAPGAHYNRFVPYPKVIPYKSFHPRVVTNMMDCFECDYRCIYPINQQLECIRRVKPQSVIDEIEIIKKENEYGRND